MSCNWLLLPRLIAIIILLVFSFGCIKLDSFLLAGDPKESLEAYHNLPSYQGDSPPLWVDDSLIEREIYLEPHTASLFDPASIPSISDCIHGVFLKAPAACLESECPLINDEITILYQHGNNGNIFLYWYRIVTLWNLGVNIFVYDYRGYGLSKGESTATHVEEDAKTALKYIESRSDVRLDRIIAYGYSMGGLVTSYLVSNRSGVKDAFWGVILEAPLDGPRGIANTSMGIDMPGGYFMGADYWWGPDLIRDVTCPVLHIHGAKDETVTLEQGKNYEIVLGHPYFADRYDYTAYLGTGWLANATHSTIPNQLIHIPHHLSEYWDDPTNPGHCCIHPQEFLEPANQDFLTDVAAISPNQAFDASQTYMQLLATWINQHLLHENE
jgi:pimeloyl-ACP methyl ester carboxylesterase